MERSAPSVATIVLAGGSGTRLGLPDGTNKVYLPLAGRPLLAWSLRALYAALDPAVAVLVVRPGDEPLADAAVDAAGTVGFRAGRPLVVAGGANRTASEVAGTCALREPIERGDVDVVLVHDGARPFPGHRMLEELVATAARHGAAVPGTPGPAGLVAVSGDRLGTVDASTVRAVQTPQAFRATTLLAAVDATRPSTDAVDTASLVALAGGPPAVVVPGDPDNLKVTHVADVERAEAVAAGRGWPGPSS